MKRLFIDTNVILDLILKREPFQSSSAKLIGGFQNPNQLNFTSSLSIANIYYIVSKLFDKVKAKHDLELIIQHIRILRVDEKMIQSSLNDLFNKFSDFEDALQFHSASSVRIDAIITRNEKHFKHSKIPVYTPEAFLKMTNGN